LKAEHYLKDDYQQILIVRKKAVEIANGCPEARKLVDYCNQQINNYLFGIPSPLDIVSIFPSKEVTETAKQRVYDSLKFRLFQYCLETGLREKKQ
jgi:hypothetical protein